jgi:phosphatidate cytidylyltransferase
MKAGRILVGAAATAVILAILAIDHYYPKAFLSAALLSIVAFTSALELCGILRSAGMPTFAPLTAFASLVVALLPAVVLRFWPGTSPFAPQAGVIFAFVILTFALAMRGSDIQAGAKAVAAGAFVLVYVGLALSFLVRIRDFPEVGEPLLLFAIGCAKVGDMGAYFAGKTFGKHALAPAISPKKTVEGAIGALLGSILSALIIWHFVKARIDLPTLLAWALVLSVAAQFGDLAESLLKRAAGTKDSSGTFATMGGVLDMVDSLLLSAPVAYILALAKGLGAVQG